MTSETTFDHPKVVFFMRKSEKNAFFSKPSHGQILICWNLILFTFLRTKIEKFTMDNFFLLMHVQDPCGLLQALRRGEDSYGCCRDRCRRETKSSAEV